MDEGLTIDNQPLRELTFHNVVVGGVEDAGSMIDVAMDSPEVFFTCFLRDLETCIVNHFHSCGLVNMGLHPADFVRAHLEEARLVFSKMLAAFCNFLFFLSVCEGLHVHLFPKLLKFEAWVLWRGCDSGCATSLFA